MLYIGIINTVLLLSLTISNASSSSCASSLKDKSKINGTSLAFPQNVSNLAFPQNVDVDV